MQTRVWFLLSIASLLLAFFGGAVVTEAVSTRSLIGHTTSLLNDGNSGGRHVGEVCIGRFILFLFPVFIVFTSMCSFVSRFNPFPLCLTLSSTLYTSKY